MARRGESADNEGMDTMLSVSDDTMWQLVQGRSPDADFLYAVTTMGVYCRPACPSPRPLRKNTRFFATAELAESNGFRACKRCDPKGERAQIAQAVVRDACDFIEVSESMPSLETLANRSGYSRFHFLRMFRDHTGVTPRSYAEGVRARALEWRATGDVISGISSSWRGTAARVVARGDDPYGARP